MMDVVTPEHARIAEEAGACAVMALERVPADIRADGGVARMSDPALVRSIKEAVTIPVMAKCRIGHFVQARILRRALELIEQSPAEDLYKQLFLVLTQAGERAEIRGDRGGLLEASHRLQGRGSAWREAGAAPWGRAPLAAAGVRHVLRTGGATDLGAGPGGARRHLDVLGLEGLPALPAEHDIAGNGAGVELAGALER
jgi:pyridoxal 5'-phosphate synthase pdxS subunit